MIYLDNSATSGFKPAQVKNAVYNAMSFLSANPGRAGHTPAVKAGMLVHKTRAKLKEFFGLSAGHAVFNLNCTQSLNMAILGSYRPGGHVITSVLEHNSVLRPLCELERAGKISITFLKPDPDGAVAAEAVGNAINPKTYMVCINHVSNVTGAIAPITQIGRLCKKNGLLFLVDAAQSAGYGGISMDGDDIDLLAVAPHKGLHAPQGVGVLMIKNNVRLSPILFGGTGTVSSETLQPGELPESLESGTLPAPVIAGLNCALSYTAVNAETNRQKILSLSSYALSNLKKIPGIRLYTAKNALPGIISFNAGALTSPETADILNEQYDICVRGGLHCAPLMHRYLDTLDTGIVRASLGIDNDKTQIDFFLNAVNEIAGG
jgi:cysteine desulfurase family protein